MNLNVCFTPVKPPFMPAMRGKITNEPFHEPTHPRPLPGGEQAFVRVVSFPLSLPSPPPKAGERLAEGRGEGQAGVHGSNACAKAKGGSP